MQQYLCPDRTYQYIRLKEWNVCLQLCLFLKLSILTYSWLYSKKRKCKCFFTYCESLKQLRRPACGKDKQGISSKMCRPQSIKSQQFLMSFIFVIDLGNKKGLRKRESKEGSCLDWLKTLYGVTGSKDFRVLLTIVQSKSDTKINLDLARSEGSRDIDLLISKKRMPTTVRFR